jgi:hypothetical protein
MADMRMSSHDGGSRTTGYRLTASAQSASVTVSLDAHVEGFSSIAGKMSAADFRLWNDLMNLARSGLVGTNWGNI